MNFIDDACGRYILKANRQELERHYNLAAGPKEIKPNYNTAPGQMMPVVVADEAGKNRLEIMHWGIAAPWKPGLALINTRDDKIFAPRSFWKGMALKRRALIPANGFYEWRANPEGPKTPFYIHPRQASLFSFAGIWSTWRDTDGSEQKAYSIVTTAPNKEMAAVHSRMPVILHPGEEAAWLDPARDNQEAVEPFLHPYEDDGLEMFEVSTAVNVVRNNDANLILPINSA